MTECAQHPGVAAEGPCSRCARMLCRNCLVELQGQCLCAPCKEAALAELRTRYGLNPARVVRWAQWFDALNAVLALGAVLLQVAFHVILEKPWYEARTSVVGGPTAAPTAYAPPLISADALWTHAAVGVIAALLALIPMVLLWNRRPFGYHAQLFSTAVSPLLAWAWGGGAALPFWLAAPVLIYFWLRPEVREYCSGEA